MSRPHLLAALLLLLASASPASAGTITVSGFVDYGLESLGVLNLAGDHGFSLTGLVPAGTVPSESLNVRHECTGLPASLGGRCSPGSLVSLHAQASFSDLEGPATATFQGMSYPLQGAGCASPPCFEMGIIFDGEFIAPAFGQSATAVLTIPVTFSGSFFHRETFESEGREDLIATNPTVTLTLRETDCCGGPAWQYEHARYDLGPVPEPTTLLLFGTTAIAIGITRWRSSRRP